MLVLSLLAHVQTDSAVFLQASLTVTDKFAKAQLVAAHLAQLQSRLQLALLIPIHSIGSMSYDPSYHYSTDPLDDELRGLDGLGGYGGSNLYNDDAGNTYDNNLALSHSFDSGLDGLGRGGLDSYGSGLDSYGGGAYDDPLSGGMGGLSLNTDLDGMNTGLGGSGLGGGTTLAMVVWDLAYLANLEYLFPVGIFSVSSLFLATWKGVRQAVRV